MNTSNIICTDRDFMEGARLFRKEILQAPVRNVMDVVGKIATLRPNVRYEEKQYEMDADMEYGNYDPTRTANLNVEITPRTLKTYFASARKEFDPNQYVHTALSSAITKGEGLKGVEAARLALMLVSKKLGDNLRPFIFNNVRSEESTGSRGLYDGWDTIAKAEIEKGAIAADLGNLHRFAEAVTADNAVDALKAFCRAADDFLVEKQNLNLIVPFSVYYNYLDDYKATTGAIPYNREFKQYYIEGFENIHLVPMAEKKDSNIIQLTTKDNMLVGTGQNGEEESIVVEKHDVVLLTFFATMFFGLDYQSVRPDRLLIGRLYNGEPAAPTISQDSNKITITGATGATIQYSTDGGATWNSYSEQISATSALAGKTILAKQTAGGKTSDIARATIVYTA